MSKKLETSSEEIDEKRYRHFMILLYEDSESYSFNDVLFDLKGSFKNYAYIKHLREDSEKKEHIHFILSLDNPRSINSLASRVGIAPNYIQSIKSLRASCRYLTHEDEENKRHYDLSDVKVSQAFSRKFYASFDDLKTEEDVIEDIYLFIDSITDVRFKDAVKALIVFVNSQAYDTIYKRYRYEFQDYLKETIADNLEQRS